MGIIYSLVVGLIAGIIAKAVMPGSSNEPSGWILTIVLGLVGAFVGGMVASLFGVGASGIASQIIFAAIGAIIVIAALRFFTGGRRAV